MQILITALFLYVFALAAIVLTVYVVQTCIRFIREGKPKPKKGDEKL